MKSQSNWMRFSRHLKMNALLTISKRYFKIRISMLAMD
ncbi:hypothetical protein P353_15440 [Comamonas testosteroni]|uniref:Uncharacterized protein n=1 Tax=Comamonas testosteroni TaxID=285 RepID=A0A096HI81_COMTE|nr:hypothetical protein P353_15440 [Comamonas testosteroni]